MLTPIPVEKLARMLAPVSYGRDVYVFIFLNEDWDVLRVDTGGVETFSCFAAIEITGRSRCFLDMEESSNRRVFPEPDMVFAVTYGEKATRDFMEKMIAIEKAYQEDIRGPLLKKHTAMAVLQASLDHD